MVTACGSTLYIAPEVLTAKSSGKGYGRECDLWAVGVMTYILLCCRPPFSGATSFDIGQSIRKGVFSYPDYALVSEEAQELIAGLLEIDPAKRLTAKEALQTSWIARVAPSPPLNPAQPLAQQQQLEVENDAAMQGAEQRQSRAPVLTSWLRGIVKSLGGGVSIASEPHPSRVAADRAGAAASHSSAHAPHSSIPLSV